jgi:hypothetical protein
MVFSTIGDFLSRIYGPTISGAITSLLAWYPVWLPLILIAIFWELWVRYVRTLAFSNTKYTVLEIRIPRDMFKSPRAMETVLNAFYQTGREGTFIDRYWKGQVRDSFSLEIVSDGGQIRFLIWMREAMRNYIESQMYAQFPEVEIHEVPDYVQSFDFKPGVNQMWGARYELSEASPLPIRTYVDYGLDENPEEEEKVDPLSQVLEFLSTVKAGEHFWFQMVIRAHKSEKRKGVFSEKTDWRKEIAETRKKVYEAIKKEERGRPTAGETELLEALSRAFQKFPFDCGMRSLYWVDKAEAFNPAYIGGVLGFMRPFSFSGSAFKGTFKQFSFGGFNGFKPEGGTGFEYPWQDFNGWRVNKNKKKLLDAYKYRSFFNPPYIYKTFILTTEALATIFHFPGATAAAPGLGRIPSKRAQAPGNLPT